MIDYVFNIGGVSVYGLGILISFCYLWGSYVFYKKATEEHFGEESILDIIVLSAFWGFIFGRIGFVLLHMGVFWKHFSRILLIFNYPGVDRWGALIGMVLASLWIANKMKYKFLDLMDCFALGLLAGSSFFWVGISLIGFKWQFVVLGVVFFVSYLVFWQLSKTYRLIDWYRASRTSARSGFISGFSIFVLGVLFLLEVLLLSKLNLVTAIWSFVLIVLGLVMVYIRSGRVLKEDINSLKIWKKIKK